MSQSDLDSSHRELDIRPGYDPSADVLLVFMPFGPLEWPSPALGQLVASCRKANINAGSSYPAMAFARRMGMPTYNTFSGLIYSDSLIQEWFFAPAAFDDRAPDGAGLISELFPDASSLGKVRAFVNDLPVESRTKYDTGLEQFLKPDGGINTEYFFYLRQMAEAFVLETAQSIVAGNPKIIGCTTTFLQYNASIALLRQLKVLNPNIVTVLGGGHCEGSMGPVTIQECPWVDYVVSGEADYTFPDLCQKILSGEDEPMLPNSVLSSKSERGKAKLPDEIIPALLDSMDDLPVPDYDSYFSELANYQLGLNFKPPIVMECSRGCWKGMRQHCAFCGLQGERMAYRAKAPEKVLSEMRELSDRYGSRSFLMTDSILNNAYFGSLLEKLEEEPEPFEIFYEIISTLGEEKVRKLARAGIQHVQPGIESLNDHLIKCLNKGNRAINSIAFLKYCREQGMKVVWNILYQIPGENDVDYSEMSRLIPLIRHLPPPRTTRVRFDRFSDYHKRPEKYAIDLQPLQRYRYVYPFDDATLDRFALFFESSGSFKSDQEITEAQWELIRLTDRWRRQYFGFEADMIKPIFEMKNNDDGSLVLIDSRDCLTTKRFSLNSQESKVYRGCRRPVRVDELSASTNIDSKTVKMIIEGFEEKALIVKIDERYLALATDADVQAEAVAFQTQRLQGVNFYRSMRHNDNQVWKLFFDASESGQKKPIQYPDNLA